MPLGAARITLLAFQPSVAVEAEVIRRKAGVSAVGNAQVDTAQSKFGGASVYFDGADDRLQIKNEDSTITLNSDYWTVEGWFRIESHIGSYNVALGIWGASNKAFYFSTNIFDTTNKMGMDYFDINGVNSGPIEFGSALSTGSWIHLAWVNNNGTVTAYQNGTSVGTHTLSDRIRDFSSEPFVIGSRSTNAGEYQGWMDEIRISNTAKYTANFTPSTTPFVNDDNTLLLLHMDGTDGSTVFEDDNGVDRARVGVSAVGNAQIDTAQSQFGGASATSGSNSDILECGSVVLPGQADYTVEFWFRLPNLTERRGFFGQYSSGATGRTDAEFINDDGGYVSFFQPPGSSFSESYRIKSNSTISANTWHHCAITRDYGGNGHTMYIDGVAQTDTIADHSGTTQQIPLEIFSPQLGTVSTDYYMDEFRVSDIVRYTANFTPSTTPFVNDANTLLLLHMDGTDASTDFSDDNGYHTAGRTGVHVNAVGNAQIDTAQSQFGGASLLLDGTDDIVAIGDDGDSNYVLIPRTGEFTWEFWVRPVDTTFQLITSVYGAYGDANPAGRVWIGINNNKFEFSVNGGSAITDASTASTGSWTHLAAVRDSSNEFRFYVNGTEVGTSYTNSVTLAAGYVAIGGTGNTYGLDFEGHVDEYRISNVCRYTANFTPSTTPFQDDENTLLLLHMNGADGSTVFTDDVGGRSPVGVSAEGNAQVDTAQSKFGGASAYIDGTDDYLTVNTGISGTGDWTIEFWFRQDATNVGKALYDGRSTGTQVAPLIYFSGASATTLRYHVNGSIRISSGATFTSTTDWYHVAICKSSGTTRMFVDGTQVGGDYSDSFDYVENSQTYIGATGFNDPANNDFGGYVDEFRISDTARYTANFTPSTEPFQNDENTLLLLHMDGTDGSTTFIDDNGTF